MTSCIMARPAVFEPPGPFHLNVEDGYPRTRFQDITNTEGHNNSQNPFPTAARTNLRRSPSSSPEAPQPQTRNIDSGNHRNNQNSFRDIFDDEPVLPMSNLRTRDESDEESQGNASTAATFAGYGRDDREEGTGDHSSDSSVSSMRDARLGRPPTRGFIRPRSYVLRDEAYVELTDL